LGCIWGGRRLKCHFHRSFKAKIQPCFGSYADLFAFSNRFHTGSGSGPGCASDDGSLASAGDCANGCPDRGANARASCRPATLGLTGILVSIAFHQVTLLSEEDPIQLELQFAFSAYSSRGLDLRQLHVNFRTLRKHRFVIDNDWCV